MFLNFSLRYTHVNHVGDQFDGSLDGAGIKVGFVGDGSLHPKLFKTTSKVVNFTFQNLEHRCEARQATGQCRLLIAKKSHEADYRCSHHCFLVD